MSSLTTLFSRFHKAERNFQDYIIIIRLSLTINSSNDIPGTNRWLEKKKNDEEEEQAAAVFIYVML